MYLGFLRLCTLYSLLRRVDVMGLISVVRSFTYILDGYFFLMFAIHLWFHLLIPCKYRWNLLLVASSFSVFLFLNNHITLIYVRFEIMITVTMKNTNCWGVTQCSPAELHWSFGRTYCLHLHSRRIKQASNNKKLAASRSSASPNYRTTRRRTQDTLLFIHWHKVHLL